jgi:hypothetical protein
LTLLFFVSSTFGSIGYRDNLAAIHAKNPKSELNFPDEGNEKKKRKEEKAIGGRWTSGSSGLSKLLKAVDILRPRNKRRNKNRKD